MRAGIDEDERTSEAVAAVGIVEQRQGGSERDAADSREVRLEFKNRLD
jgi:hypothetical protein